MPQERHIDGSTVKEKFAKLADAVREAEPGDVYTVEVRIMGEERTQFQILPIYDGRIMVYVRDAHGELLFGDVFDTHELGPYDAVATAFGRAAHQKVSPWTGVHDF